MTTTIGGIAVDNETTINENLQYIYTKNMHIRALESSCCYHHLQIFELIGHVKVLATERHNGLESVLEGEKYKNNLESIRRRIRHTYFFCPSPK
jgi:hypothetical protein